MSNVGFFKQAQWNAFGVIDYHYRTGIVQQAQYDALQLLNAGNRGEQIFWPGTTPDAIAVISEYLEVVPVITVEFDPVRGWHSPAGWNAAGRALIRDEQIIGEGFDLQDDLRRVRGSELVSVWFTDRLELFLSGYYQFAGGSQCPAIS